MNLAGEMDWVGALVGTIQPTLSTKAIAPAPPGYKFRLFIVGQRLRMPPKIKRQMRRRSAIEPVIGHIKAEHRMGRNYPLVLGTAKAMQSTSPSPLPATASVYCSSR
jgi:hypothetical protein